MKLEQSQSQVLSQQQLQSLELLHMSTQELEACIQELALNNPMVEPEEYSAPDPADERDSELLDRLRWLDETDHQNRFYQRMDRSELDPVSRISSDGGLEETLFRFISRQLYPMTLSESEAQNVRYLAGCLDDDGYLRVTTEELSASSHIPEAELDRALALLRTLEPAGIGASSLSQCLKLQLERIHYRGPAMKIVEELLEPLARRQYRTIADSLDIPVSQVHAAEKVIQELEPRPGAVFQHQSQSPYILPDIFVEDVDGELQVRTRRDGRPLFHISSYYRELLQQTDDQEVKEYLSGMLSQAEDMLYAVNLRESTLLRCAQSIARHQREFFRSGPGALVPLRMADVAQELGLHESTISRAVREKYLQCSRGVYPLNFFFSRPAAGEKASELGGTAARVILRRLIDEEDKEHPLSDSRLAEMMAAQGCPVSRRTVTKYRERLEIPSSTIRRRR